MEMVLIFVVILVIADLCFLGFFDSGCNKQVFDTAYTFKRAIISLPNGEVIDGDIQSWTDFEDGDQIQVKIDGKRYLVHSSNIVLITK